MNKYINIKKAKIINYCSFLILFTILFYSFLYCMKINLYTINIIKVHGNKFVDSNIIENIVNNSIKHKNIFTIQRDILNKKITNNQYIYTCKIYTEFPSTISILINEIKPLALFEENSKYYFIDANYVKVKANIDAINHFSVPILSTNDVAIDKHNKVIDILRYTNLKNINLYKSLKEIRMEADNIYFIIQSNTIIEFNINNLENNICKLIEFLQIIDGKKSINSYKYVNLSIPNQIIVKEKHI